MKVSIGMEPGEIFMALEIVKNSKSTLTQVLDIYKKDKSKGWGYIAKQAGIKPGSAAFHQLKDNAKGRKGKAKGKPTRVKVKQQTSVKAKGKSKGKGNGKGN